MDIAVLLQNFFYVFARFFAIRGFDEFLLVLLAIDQHDVREVDDAIKGRHDFVAQTCRQLLREITLQLTFLSLKDSSDVVDHKDLLVFDPNLDPLDFYLQNFCLVEHCAQLRRGEMLTLSQHKFRHRLEVTMKVFVQAGK